MTYKRQRTSDKRQASTYVLVLGATLIVSTLAMGGILAVRGQTRISSNMADITDARLCALAAIEWGRLQISQDANWRNDFHNGPWATNQPVGNAAVSPAISGTFTLQVVNPNGNLNNADTDPVRMTATGVKGQATQIVQVQLNANKQAFTSLNAALCAASSVTFNATMVQAANQVLATNSTMTASGATINANVEANSTISGGTFLGTSKTNVQPRTMPAVNTVFSYYQANGTAISVSSLPTSGGNYQLTNVVLSPATNPFGSQTNSNGVYVIDCAGSNIIITSVRVVGTLLLLNPGPGSAVQGNLNWWPAVANYPCLLVNGSIALNYSGGTLSDSSANSANFNPTNPSAVPYPWPSGMTDNTFSTTYPSEIHGLVYVSGNVTSSNSPVLNVLTVGGTYTGQGSLTLNYDPVFFNNPPPGFYSTQMIPAPGSWTQMTQ